MDPKCPMCGGTEFDQPRSIVPFSQATPLVYLIDGDRAFAHSPEFYTRIKGRACKNCGYVFLMVNPEKLRGKLIMQRMRQQREKT